MLEYYKNHPLLAVLIAALIIGALFLLFKVSAASEKRAKKNQQLIKKLEKDKSLREKYSFLTEELISSAPEEELFRAVGLNLMKRVADKADMSAEFDSLSQGQRLIYSAFVFTEDSADGMSCFFKLNGSPVTDCAKAAVDSLTSGEFASLFDFEFSAYDGDNEEVSCIPSEIDEADKKAAPFLSDGTVSKEFGRYIKSNPAEFL